MGETRPKQAACLVCRRSKTKCDWTSPDHRCKRCTQLGQECVRPDFHAGRQKGIKKVGLDKALFQVEQAVKRARSGQQQTEQDDRVLTQVRVLMGQTDGSDWPSCQLPNNNRDQDSGENDASSSEDVEHLNNDETSASSRSSEAARCTGESLTGDDAENPLQLLARAGLLSPVVPRYPEPERNIITSHAHEGGSLIDRRCRDDAKLNLDVGSDIDPVELGLVTEDEAEFLFQYTDDEACMYMSVATSIAIDLCLHKRLAEAEPLHHQDSGLALARVECLDTRTALAMDGYPGLDPCTARARLLLRNRERCWISLSALDVE
ncbi:hypothetical protein E4U41_002889 [Claviceps citrina]|nr:hypothetical protein E4U41_002889 [Claviceps citrina]